jgi:hypothetical protein
MLPVVENISGTISAAVMVGEMTAMFCATSSTRLRQCGLSRDSVGFMGFFVYLGYIAWFCLLTTYDS